MNADLDPDIANALPRLPDWDVPTLTPDKARDLLLGLARARKDQPLPQVAVIEDRLIGTGIPVRIYRASEGPAPTVMFFHGGGFVAGDLETHDRQARWLAVDLGAVVVSVDYRRPPQARFPAALDDSVLATRWAAKNIAQLGADPARLAVAGDSAGGNLAAGVALACRDQGPELAAQLLVYPVTDCRGGYADESINASYPSRTANESGYFLSTQVMQWFCQQYFSTTADGNDPKASPLLSPDLSGLAPAVVCTAQFDPLRDEGIAYAQRLRDAGVQVREHRGPGLIHGYFGMVDSIAAAGREASRAREDFRQLLAQGSS